MVIKIFEKYEDELMKNGLSDSNIDSIEFLFELMRQKKLFFRCTLNFYAYLLNNYSDVLSKGVKGLIHNVINNPLILSEAKQIKPLIIINNKNINLMRRFSCTHIRFDSLPTELTPYICCENCTDSFFFLRVFYNCSIFKKQHIYLLPEGYGGSGLSTICNWFNTKRLFLIVADSDKKYRSCQPGNTACMVENLFFEKKPPFATNYILQVHEKENLFPFELMKLKTPMKEIVDYLLSSSFKNINDYRDYFDIKGGLSKEYYRNKCKESLEFKRLYFPIVKYIKENHLSSIQPKAKKYFYGVGDKEIENRISEGVDFKLFWSLLTPTQKDDFLNIFNLIIIYGYSYGIITN